MEVREHPVYGRELMSGQYEKIGFAGARDEAIMSFNDVFECARGGRSHGNHAAAFSSRMVQAGRGLRTQFESLRLQDMPARIIRTYWNESSDSDMQGQLDDLNSARLQPLEHVLGEVKTSCR